jgi:hypothetical protein
MVVVFSKIEVEREINEKIFDGERLFGCRQCYCFVVGFNNGGCGWC